MNDGLTSRTEPTATNTPQASLIVVVVSLVIAATLLTLIAAGPGTVPGDVALARWVQGAPAAIGAPLARVGYWAGSGAVVYAIGVALLLGLGIRGRRREAAVVLGVLLLRALNPLLKLVIASPRPGAEQVLIGELATGNGFPSGHTFGATLLYGAVIWLAARTIPTNGARRFVQIVATMLILITGFGRVYHGAHWPTDVLGGFLWGVAGLLALIAASARLPLPEPPVRSGTGGHRVMG